MCVAVQRTVIEEGRVEMIIADQPMRDSAIVWIHFSMPINVGLARRVTEVRREALQRLRSLLDDQIQATAHTLGPAPEVVRSATDR